MNASRRPLGTQDTLDRLTGRPHFRSAPKADMPCDLPPPALAESRHRRLARRLVAVRRRAVLVLSECDRPEPRPTCGGGRLELSLRTLGCGSVTHCPLSGKPDIEPDIAE